jgi:hypothetical protein
MNDTIAARWFYSDTLHSVAELNAANQLVARFMYAEKLQKFYGGNVLGDACE